MAAINFVTQSISFKPPFPRKTSSWIRACIKKQKRSLKELTFIFCTDQELLKINRQYLNHSTYTDIITFDNSESDDEVEGDIFISIERVKDNAKSLAVDFADELNRVMIHGVLHLLGYTDKTPKAKLLMRKKEDACLSLRDKV